ncbi:hypothetical protein ERE07_16195 [Allopusillimonas ginsengisoli]|nr:hypothetical protein ERE07_16195 [Allopusillimonas ginsengisoli]
MDKPNAQQYYFRCAYACRAYARFIPEYRRVTARRSSGQQKRSVSVPPGRRVNRSLGRAGDQVFAAQAPSVRKRHLPAFRQRPRLPP